MVRGLFIMLYIVIIGILILLITFIIAGRSAAPWVPTKGKNIARAIAAANIKPGQTVVDIGCGDGRLVFAAADKGAKAVGYEISLIPYLIAKIRWLFSSQRQNVSIRFKNLWRVNLDQVDILYVFLLPQILGKLEKKLEKELQPGAKVIVHCWAMPTWTPDSISDKENELRFYIYTRP